MIYFEQIALRRRKRHRYLWALGGIAAGVVLGLCLGMALHRHLVWPAEVARQRSPARSSVPQINLERAERLFVGERRGLQRP